MMGQGLGLCARSEVKVPLSAAVVRQLMEDAA